MTGAPWWRRGGEGLHRIMVGIGAAVVGLDLGAALTLADALGLSFFIAAEVLSDIEPAVVSALNRAIGDR